MKTSLPARLLALCMLALTLASCDSIIDKKPASFISPENFYGNAADARSALAGAYNQLTQGTFAGYIGSYQFILMVEKPSAEVLGYGGGLDLWDWTAGSSERDVIPTAYSGAYKGINAANAVIENVPEIEDMDAQLRERYVAEARFLRDFHYYYLVGLFGGVPLVTSETVGLVDLNKPRATETEIYQFLIEDLTAAIEVLPRASEYAAADRGRVSKGAAQTLLGKVYLQRGSLNGANGIMGERAIAQPGDFQQAADIFQEVIDSGEYSLPDDIVSQFTDLFIEETSGGRNPETIFSLPQDPANGLGTSLPCLVAPHPAGEPMVGSSWNQYQSELPFFQSFEEADLRKSVTFVLEFPHESTGETITYDVANTETYGHDTPTFRKYADAAPGVQCEDDNDFILLRYADVLLMKAEALNEAHMGPSGEAYEAINQVRRRAGLDDLAGLGYDQFREAVYTENRKELVTEGHGWHTLQRFWELATQRVREHAEFDAQFPGRAYGPNLDNLDLGEEDRLFPIPETAISRNPELTQNPGY